MKSRKQNVLPRVHRREIRIQRQRMNRNIRVPINRPLHIARNSLVLRYPSFRHAEEGRVGALYSVKPQAKTNLISHQRTSRDNPSETLAFCSPAGGILTNVPSAPFVKR